MPKKGKRLRQAYEAIDRHAHYELNDALALVREKATAKFDETVEFAISLGVDPRHADQMVRGVVALPHGTGKVVRVAVFAKDDKAKEAEEAGADMVGGEDLAETIRNGEIHFDRCIATPDMMAVVGKLGRILGPRGLMPNPKLGTVTPNVAEAITAAKAGQIEYRVEKAGIIHAGVGKASFSVDALNDNIKALVGALQKARPTATKGTYFKRMSVSSSMGPGVRVNVASVVG